LPRASAPAAARPGLLLGTAGHIDHGKTWLVRALTGVDTDRLPEEKARGITVELGFAPLDLPGGPRLSVVDVPGHEGLVRTMVAGATGIDLLLFVVAADEGVMPQTREHLAICDLLGIDRGVVALTKADAAPADVAELAEEELRALLADTSLREAEVVRVSARTGFGLEALRASLAEVAAGARPRTPRTGPPRLPVDRRFAVRGFGTVVTGSLTGGALAVGDAVELHPLGLAGRVRGLETHGERRERAEPGFRVAVNVQGIPVERVSRGQVLSTPGALALTRTVDVEIAWLGSSPPVHERVDVELLVGAAERRARLAPIGTKTLRPGETGFARAQVQGEPLPVLPGDRFVVRGFAKTELGGATLGGGVVLDAAPPRRRRSDPAVRADLEALRRCDPETAVRVRVERSGLAGAARERLRRETGLGEAEVAAALDALASAGRVGGTGAGTALAAAAAADLEARAEAALEAFHAEAPLRPGMPVAALRGALPRNVPSDVAELVLARLLESGRIRREGDLVRRFDHRPALDPESRTLLERVRSEARAAGLEPPSERDWAERLGIPRERLRELLAHAEREGALVRAPGDLWFDRPAVDALREKVVAHLRAHGALDTSAYKALVGTTRRTAVPLMELFDAEHLTVRRGNARVLRRG